MADPKLVLRAIDLITAPAAPRRGKRPEVLHADIEQARSVVDDDNTVGVGVGYKITGGRVTNEVVLQVYVEKKRSARELRAAEAAPMQLEVAGKVVPTDIIETGRVVPEVLKQRTPVQPGYSVGHSGVNSAGTLGAVVTSGGRYHILSNSHVIALSGKGKKGDAIVYPGRLDGGKTGKDNVARLAKFKKFATGGAYTNRVDAAVARVDDDRLKELRSEIKGLGVPKGVVAKKGLKLGAQVVKTGRTTGKKGGRIIGLNARLRIDYKGVGKVGFRDQVLCTRYSKPGDSGSLVLDAKSKKAVGLHFAGGPGGSFFNPIEHVTKALGVKLVTTAIKRTPAKTRRGRRKA
jgi:hypothetical protein